ncbi:hypothetical protein ACLOJK_014928 [Asimina triloba]
MQEDTVKGREEEEDQEKDPMPMPEGFSSATLMSFDETGRADGRGQGAVLELIYECFARGGTEALFKLAAETTPVREFFDASVWVATPPLGRGWGGHTYTHQRQLITSEDLVAIRDSYSIPSNIVLSPSDSHETSRDYRPKHICLNESMLRAGVRIPFEFRVIEALLAFHVSLRMSPPIPGSEGATRQIGTYGGALGLQAAPGLCSILQER